MRLLNSWGTTWADNGFFNVKDLSVLGSGTTCVDIFWYIKDLTKNEEKTFLTDQAELVKERAKFYKSTLKQISIQCPLCKQKSNVTEFDGNLLEACCPKCHGKFKPDSIGKYFTAMIYEKNRSV